jgi:hypothetical protein
MSIDIPLHLMGLICENVPADDGYNTRKDIILPARHFYGSYYS